MLTVTMCTGNEGKFRTAQEHLAPWGVEVEQTVLELDEIQTTSVAVIAQHKARQAFELLQRPLFVEDSGFFIDEFKGWPGPMVKHALEAFGPDGLTHLAALTKTRSCRFASAAVYVDADSELHTFADDTRSPGTIAPVPDRGDGPRSWSDLCRSSFQMARQRRTLLSLRRSSIESSMSGKEVRLSRRWASGWPSLSDISAVISPQR